MPPFCRLLQHVDTPRDPTWTGWENPVVNPRGRALVDIEFLMLNPLGACVVTTPVRHLGLLGYLFPNTLFHVYNCEPHEAGQEQNIYRITGPLNDAAMNLWGTAGEAFSVVFTNETDARQLAIHTKRSPSVTLFCWRSLPSDHLGGDIFLPIYPQINSTLLFLHHIRTNGNAVVAYDTRALGEVVWSFNQSRHPEYDDRTEHSILTFAFIHKLKREDCPADPAVVEAIVESLRGVLPGAREVETWN